MRLGALTTSACKCNSLLDETLLINFESSNFLVIRDEFEAAIQQEERDRIKYHDDALNPIRAQLKGITDGLVKEKKTRIANEKQIVSKIEAECNKMHANI